MVIAGRERKRKRNRIRVMLCSEEVQHDQMEAWYKLMTAHLAPYKRIQRHITTA